MHADPHAFIRPPTLATPEPPPGFTLADFNAARPFSSFLPGIAGECGKPMWVFYANRGQCICSFGVRDKDGAMLEFHPANKAYALAPLHGFRTFLRWTDAGTSSGASGGATVYEPFSTRPAPGVTQRLHVRAEDIEIEEIHPTLGLRLRVVYFTLPQERLPALVRHVTLENLGPAARTLDVLDGLPQVVPFGLGQTPLKAMSRTMEAFAEVRHAESGLPFFKLKVEPSDKPEVTWIDGGFFAFTLRRGQAQAIVTDPDLVFGADTSLRTPTAFEQRGAADLRDARRDTLTGCAFAQMRLTLAPGEAVEWQSCYGQAPDWEAARALRDRLADQPDFARHGRAENARLIRDITDRFTLLAGPPELAPYTRQAFLDNTLRGGQPVVIDGLCGPKVFHTSTRKHGDMERDYNFFELAPSCWSQGNGNFRDVNQNRRAEHFIYPAIDAANVVTFFNLLQIDGNNPLVIGPERFAVPEARRAALQGLGPAATTPGWAALLSRTFGPGELLDAQLAAGAAPAEARQHAEAVLRQADLVQVAHHGEGYWVDHWIYNLDLLESYAALFPDRMRHLLVGRRDFSFHDSDHIVQPRDRKHLLRADGRVRQSNAVVRDAEKARLIANRIDHPHAMRSEHGHGAIYRTTLLAKLISLLAVKATLLDPSGIGLEMEADKPGWCDALNGLPGLFGSSTHEAHALRRGLALARQAVHTALAPGDTLALPTEVATLLHTLTDLLAGALQAPADDFFPTWDRLATLREQFRASTRLGVQGDDTALSADELLTFIDTTDRLLQRGLARAVDGAGLPISYYQHEALAHEAVAPVPLPATTLPQRPDATPAPVAVRVLSFRAQPVSLFLEGAVQALRGLADIDAANALYRAVRQSPLYDAALGMYRVNAPLDGESHEIGRSRIFSPGWLENESIFLHMHYKFLLETLRSGLAEAFFADLRRGLVAFHDPQVYGRSPLENSSFIASSRFPDAKVHGVGFVARLSGATAEWISMVLHMGLGATPFREVDGALRFEPRPVLADWLFTDAPSGGFAANSFGLKLFGDTWVVYENPSRRSTFGADGVRPVRFELQGRDGRRQRHDGAWLPQDLATSLRCGEVATLVILLQ